MLYINDVWVNWFEGEENGYNVCHFHEWRKDDPVELLDQVPVIKVTDELYRSIENDMVEIPKPLLDYVHNQSFVRKNHERIQLEYCFIVTSGFGILVVDTVGYKLPIRKSRLIPRQEQLVFELVENKEVFRCKIEAREREPLDYHLLSPNPNFMYGLTRSERQLKQVLFMALESLYCSKDLSQLKYWFTEWDPAVYNQWKNMTYEELWNQFFEGVCGGWSKRHEELTEKMVKGQSFLERMWELERGSKVN